uniref:Uncharacterized protein n=1 Tax=Anguilla anguilla TaxID=7936 RepID=A0A0E9VAX3_ANGAN
MTVWDGEIGGCCLQSRCPTRMTIASRVLKQTDPNTKLVIFITLSVYIHSDPATRFSPFNFTWNPERITFNTTF